MKTITLYRLVHQAVKRGPWHSINAPEYKTLPGHERIIMRTLADKLDDYFAADESRLNKRPCFFVDIQFGLDSFTDYLCAVESLEELRAWFAVDHLLNMFLDANYTIVELTVDIDTVRRGKSGTQVAFRPEGIIAEKDLTILALVA